jgi:hypothetical protein
MSQLRTIAQRFLDAFHEDPGHSDLDREQPIHITVTLGDLRDLRWALSSVSETVTREIAPPTEGEIAVYRNVFREELDKNMKNSSGSPSTDAHRVALHNFVRTRNGRHS